jgi:hypothetical protein
MLLMSDQHTGAAPGLVPSSLVREGEVGAELDAGAVGLRQGGQQV